MQRRDWLRALGGAAAASALAPLPLGERLRMARALHGRLRPGIYRALAPQEVELVAALADAIIPPTDSPGARQVGVPEFVDLLLHEWYPEDERDRFRRGLSRIEDEARRAGAPFARLREPARTRLLERLDATRGELDTAAGAFARMKSLTVYGYFTSREVQTSVLRTVVLPGRYLGCATPET